MALELIVDDPVMSSVEHLSVQRRYDLKMVDIGLQDKTTRRIKWVFTLSQRGVRELRAALGTMLETFDDPNVDCGK